MADQNTTNYSFIKPEIGASEDTWGEKLNDNWDSADTEIKALEDSKVNNTGAETITGVKTFSDGIVSNVTGDLIGDAATLNGLTAAQIFPTGLISMWSGTNANIPSGWLLCDGANGTPDLTDRFVLGVSDDSRGALGSSHTATTSSAGAHSHGGSTQSHTLTTSQIPSHTHSNSYLQQDSSSGNVTGGSNLIMGSLVGTLGFQNRDTTSTGSGAGHTHGLDSDGSHSHTVDTRGKYYKLAFIMKS